MENQVLIIKKEDAHRLIDSVPGDTIPYLPYDKSCGISGDLRIIKKGKCKRMASRAGLLVLSESGFAAHLDMHNILFHNKNIVESVILPTKNKNSRSGIDE